MRKQLLLIISISGLLFACGGESTGNSSNGNNGRGTTGSKTTGEVLPVIVDFQLIANKSKADWERTLDQKPTKQKVKLFDQMVDVDLGAVKLNTNGSVTIKDGTLRVTDDELTEATMVFDMASFKFAKEKGNGLFDVKNHPNSKLVLTDISKNSAKGKLTVQGTTKSMDVKITTKKSANGQTIKGSFVVNTLDFPLRDKVTAKDINKDEIKVTFDLNYGSNN